MNFARVLRDLNWFWRAIIHASMVVVSIAAGVIFVGVAQRQGWIATSTGSDETKAAHSGIIYTCPMHPQIRQNQPSRCPICGMSLEPVIATSNRDTMSVTIEPAARRLAGIRTVEAELGPISQTIRTIGMIQYDESRLATISAYVDGRIEKLYADYVGVPVSKDDDLAFIYSPELYSAQVEYLTAVQGNGLKRLGGSSNLLEFAAQKLIELGFTERQVDDLRESQQAESRIRVRSPISGTVIQKFAVEGDYIKTGDKIYRIADLSTVWMMLDLYPDDAARIRFGQQVQAEVSSLPGKIFSGRVAFIDPTVDPIKRTVSVRVEVSNPDRQLKPGDYATARVYLPAIHLDRIYDPDLANKFISPMHPQIIRDKPGSCPICGMDLIPTTKLGFANEPLPEQMVVTVPRDAVLMTGEDSVVYVESEPGRFEIRRVIVGPMTDDRAVIVEGLAGGESVATNGNFLIDSQMQLAGNPSLMDSEKANMYAMGPLKLTPIESVMLGGEAARRFDRAYVAYFAIQQFLAADNPPPGTAIQEMVTAVDELLVTSELSDSAFRQLRFAKQALSRMDGSLEQIRAGFRPLSHAMLRLSALASSPMTSKKLVHMHCPMVPGGGGDWIQLDDKLVNPYWGNEMLNCGEIVDDANRTTSK
ncbi:MAG: efflux RND transporter periplasmic adaptor subunit [Planctomycetales bacterium]|nr:efflux RND transporter periplasmic adaptor subunit [Planctomycetales bacterium]